MGMFSYRDLSADQVLEAAEFSRAAYENQPIPKGYKALKDQLGLDESNSDGNFYKPAGILGLPIITWAAARALPLISDDGKKVVLAFRGTDYLWGIESSSLGEADLANYVDLLSDNSQYIKAFAPLLDKIDEFIRNDRNDSIKVLNNQNQVSEVLVTGHSLGGGAANQLVDIANDLYKGTFSDADFITFASPYISSSSDILNIGHENDWVFKATDLSVMVAGASILTNILADRLGLPDLNLSSERPDHPNATNSLVYFNEEYSNSKDNKVFDLFTDVNAHGIREDPVAAQPPPPPAPLQPGQPSPVPAPAVFVENTQPSPYIDTIQRVKSSAFYDEMNPNSVVIVQGYYYDGIVSDIPSITSNHSDLGAYILGRDNKSDHLVGGKGYDHIEGWSGKGGRPEDVGDTLEGGGGNDWLLGGNSKDTLSGGADEDILCGGNGNDTMSGGSELDTFYSGNGKDVVTSGNFPSAKETDGDDTMTGDQGPDQFDFTTGNQMTGNDTITDFDSHYDSISLPDGTITKALINGNTVLTHPGGTLTLAGIDLSPIPEESLLAYLSGDPTGTYDGLLNIPTPPPTPTPPPSSIEPFDLAAPPPVDDILFA